MDPKPRLVDLAGSKIRVKHYSMRIERVYPDWIRRFILFHHKRHPASMEVLLRCTEMVSNGPPWQRHIVPSQRRPHRR
jgi:hypothetical protein